MQPAINILLIDDDPTFIFLTRKIISSAGYPTHVDECNDGQEAVEYLQLHVESSDLLPDIIFLDLSMPVMDGWEFLKEYVLLEPLLKKKIALYIVSSSISPHDVERAKSFEIVKEFIIKPLNKTRVSEILSGTQSSFQPSVSLPL